MTSKAVPRKALTLPRIEKVEAGRESVRHSDQIQPSGATITKVRHNPPPLHPIPWIDPVVVSTFLLGRKEEDGEEQTIV